VREIILIGVSQGYARHLECDAEDAESFGIKPLAVGEVWPDPRLIHRLGQRNRSSLSGK
jgi:hypothetical protein